MHSTYRKMISDSGKICILRFNYKPYKCPWNMSILMRELLFQCHRQKLSFGDTYNHKYFLFSVYSLDLVEEESKKLIWTLASPFCYWKWKVYTWAKVKPNQLFFLPNWGKITQKNPQICTILKVWVDFQAPRRSSLLRSNVVLEVILENYIK